MAVSQLSIEIKMCAYSPGPEDRERVASELVDLELHPESRGASSKDDWEREIEGKAKIL